MQRWTPIAGCVGQAEGTHVTWADHCAEIERLKQVRCEGCGYLVSEREHLGCKSEKTLKDLERLTTERDNAEKREYEVLGRANALEAELKATQARLVASDEQRAMEQEIEKMRMGLENCRLLAARHRKEDWALLILGFCAEAGVVGSVTR